MRLASQCGKDKKIGKYDKTSNARQKINGYDAY
jgi:hypothetical protein